MSKNIWFILLTVIIPFSSYANVIDMQDKVLNQVERNLPKFNDFQINKFSVLNNKTISEELDQEIKNEGKFFIRTIVIDPLVPELKFLQIIADEHSNKVYTTKDINSLLQKLNEALLNKGYITSKVLLKAQNLSTGILKLSLIVGRVEAIKFNNKGYYGNVLPFKKGQILNVRELEQTIDNLNSVLNQKAIVKLEPGSKVGDTVVIFNVENNARFEINTSVDNFGNEDTGNTQGNLSLAIAKPLNINDSLYYSVTKSFPFEDKRGSSSHYISYSIPLGRDNFTLSHSYSDYEQEISYAINPFKSSGKFTTKEFIWTHLLHRNSKIKTELINKLVHKTRHSFINDNEIDVQKRRTTTWEIGVHQTRYINNGLIDWYLGYSRGINLWAEPGPTDALGGATTKHNIYLGKFNFIKQFAVNKKRKGTYKLEFKGQYTTSNLYASEFFSLGGWNAVRGFSGDINLSADKGFYVRNTIEIPTSDLNNIYLGFDYGKLGYSSELLGTELAGVVIGIKGKYKNFTYNIFGTYPVKKPAMLKVPHKLLGLQFNLKY